MPETPASPTSAPRRFRKAPTIRTKRLLLRAHRLEDFDAAVALWSDPVVTRHIGGRPFSVDETWFRLLRYAGLWPLLGFGYWAVEERASGRFVGEVGFADFKRAIEPPLDGMPEVGWVLSPSAHGKGLATEAVGAALAWGDGYLEAATTACIIDPTNVASLKVARKCGFEEFARTTFRDHPTIVLRRPSARPS